MIRLDLSTKDRTVFGRPHGNIDKLAVATAVAGLLTMILAVVLMQLFPAKAALTEGFRTPVLAFEFAKSEADLAFLAGQGAAAINHRSDMDRGQRVDMIFPFAYAGLIALLLAGLARNGTKSAWLGFLFALAIVPADIRENLVMLEITAALERGQPIGGLLPALQAATWLKWWCIAISTGFLAIGFFQGKSWLAGTLSLVAAGAIVLTWVTDGQPEVVEAMAIAVAVFFVFFSVRSLLVLRQAQAIAA